MTWTDSAACAEVGQELYFSDEQGAHYVEGKRICRTCPVRLQCLTEAVRNEERDGLWGGFSGRVLRRITADNALAWITADEVKHDRHEQAMRDGRQDLLARQQVRRRELKTGQYERGAA